MYLNSKILYGVRSQKDVAGLSKAQLDRLVVAIRAAETLIGMGLRSQEYASMFRYGELYAIIQNDEYLYAPSELVFAYRHGIHGTLHHQDGQLDPE
jgi:hypothetical protein